MAEETHSSKRWLLASVVVPISVALIGSVTVAIQKMPGVFGTHPGVVGVLQTAAPASPSPSVAPLPAADPIPAAWCFECNPHLVPVARECRDGSMGACDDLWKAVSDPVHEEDAAIRDYGVSCGGRRQLKSPGYRYKDCTDEFPGHD